MCKDIIKNVICGILLGLILVALIGCGCGEVEKRKCVKGHYEYNTDMMPSLVYVCDEYEGEARK